MVGQFIEFIEFIGTHVAASEGMQHPGAEWSRRPSAEALAEASAQFVGQSFGAIPAPLVRQILILNKLDVIK
ncbi:hypothetical protein QYM36_004354 [Artemia franciscana]|uniref:Uncharacterized protein n=1 Tax=Artemia franciscana TaxID=6661 RepID=A0AA88I2J5_ARTSF|nr:hypothetical protein QYM36_004354 [Artemia franciscana]